LPGSVFAAVLWTVLQVVGSYYVSHQVVHAKSVYEPFALVIGLMAWLYLGAQVTVYGAEINVVRKERLWPRGMILPPLTEGDKRSYAHEARVEDRRPEERLEVSFPYEPGQREAG